MFIFYFYRCFHSADSKSQTYLYGINHIDDTYLYLVYSHYVERIKKTAL